MQKAAPYSSTRTRQLVITAMSIALVLVATLFINIKLPIASSGGLVHMGTAMLFLIAILFGPRTALIAGAIGMGLFDLISGWTLWAPFTIVARGLQGYIVGRI
ncbi:MAG TPA: ECF transporter S component, partial [Exiguobacterium sp.]|nr:ECF transporter S component [Exiguobacterium sp.]